MEHTEKIKTILYTLTDEKYKKFMEKLIPGCNNILGVRIPELRKIAKQLSKDSQLRYLAISEENYFEEIMLKGLIIGELKTDIHTVLYYIKLFIPKIDNWSVCDSFCSSLKIFAKNKKIVWDFLQTYLRSSNTYEIRFAVVSLLFYFIDTEHLNKIFTIFDRIQHKNYYVKMSVSWAISICFVKFPQKTMYYLKNNNLDNFTYKKALQKIIESQMVDANTKNIIRGLKKENDKFCNL